MKCPLSTRDLVDRIILFTEKFAQTEFYTYQMLPARRLVESLLKNDGATITGLFSRQAGKSETVANTCVALAVILPLLAKQFPDDERLQSYKRGFLIGIYAPIEEQATISYERMRNIIARDAETTGLDGKPRTSILQELGIRCTKNTGNSLKFDNGSIILAKTASPNSSIEGQTHHLIIGEESQGILRSKMEKEIRPMLASTNGTMFMIGTAGESRGGFHVSIQTNQEIHQRTGVRNHFEFPYDIVIAEKRVAYEKTKNSFHLKYEKFVQSEITRLGGIDSPEFKMNYRCLWQESNVIAIRPELFKRAALVDREMAPPLRGDIVGGLDLGKVRDRSVLSLIEIDRSNPIRNIWSLPGADEEKQTYYSKTLVDLFEIGGSFEGNTGQYQLLISYLMQTGIKLLVVDATGLGGDVIFERISHMIGNDIICVPFKFTGLSKSNLFRYYVQEIHAQRFHYAAGVETQKRMEYSKFMQEHLDLDKLEGPGYPLFQAPEGGHDDYPDSCALACWAEKIYEESAIPEIIVDDLNFTSRSQHRQGGAYRGDRYRR